MLEATAGFSGKRAIGSELQGASGVNKNRNGFCLEVGIGGMSISTLCPGQPHAEMISGAECQSAFVNDSGSSSSLSPSLYMQHL